MTRPAFPLRCLVLVLLLCGGCAAPQPGDRAGLASQLALRLEAQGRVLQNARSAYDEGRYESAVRLLQRLIETDPRSPYSLDARWWLARSYERSGNQTAALAEYRSLTRLATPGTPTAERYGREALDRIADLERVLGVRERRSNGHTGLLIPPERIPATPDEMDWWVGELAQAGITTILLEAGTRPSTGEPNGEPQRGEPAGVYYRTTWATTVQDLLGPLVPVAHRHGLAVFAAVTLRRMNWLAPELGWNDRSYDPVPREHRPSHDLDLFNPAFQEYLVGLLTDLATTAVDGMLFRADAPLGPYDGFSSFGLRGFEQDFTLKLDPESLYPQAEAGNGGRTPRVTQPGPQARSDYPPEFWRWTGWKTRETLKVMDRLRRAMRAHSPRLRVALEVHPEAVTDPVRALVAYGEDLLQSKLLGFDYYLSGIQHSAFGVQHSAISSSAERAIELIGNAEQVWVAVPLPEGDLAQPRRLLKPASDRAALAKGIGLIYVERVASLP